jgi:hypothetical protein
MPSKKLSQTAIQYGCHLERLIDDADFEEETIQSKWTNNATENSIQFHFIYLSS